jgi:thermostable 8-oxoguanine DNA glycosylase
MSSEMNEERINEIIDFANSQHFEEELLREERVDILEAVGDSRRHIVKAMNGIEKELGKGVFNNQYEELQEIYKALDKFYKNWR